MGGLKLTCPSDRKISDQFYGLGFTCYERNGDIYTVEWKSWGGYHRIPRSQYWVISGFASNDVEVRLAAKKKELALKAKRQISK